MTDEGLLVDEVKVADDMPGKVIPMPPRRTRTRRAPTRRKFTMATL
jgi:hypothetical protein